MRRPGVRSDQIPSVPGSQRRCGHTSRRPVAHRATVALLVVSLLHLSPVSFYPVRAQSSGEAFDAAMARLDLVDDALGRVRAGLDRTRFDLAALSLEVAFDDANELVARLRSTIAYEPYAGVLRGADGTLRSGAGNAHDQAVLLATLLHDAGYDARVALGRLSVADAERLVAGAFERPAIDGIGSTSTWSALEALASLSPDGGAMLAELAAASQSDRSAANTVEAERVRAAEATIVAAIGAERFGRADSIATVVSEAQDYAWVEYLEPATNAWTALHPAWRVGEPPVRLMSDEILAGSVTERLQHRVRFQAFVERRVGDQLEVHPLMASWERPVAAAADRAFTFAAVPIDFGAYSAALADPSGTDPIAVDLEAALALSTFFMPLFDGLPVEGAMAFDLDGNVALLDASADPAEDVFRDVTNAGNRAAGALGALGGAEEAADDPATALTALYYETTLIAPGGDEHTERRYVFDRIGTANREAGVDDLDVPFEPHDVLTAVTWSVHHGRVNQDWYLDLVVGRLLAARPVVELMIEDIGGGRAAPNDRVAALLVDLEEDGVAAATLEHLELALQFDRAPVSDGDVVAFRPSPTVIAIERGFAAVAGLDGSVLRLSTDIQANERRVLRRSVDGAVEVGALEALRFGIWETAAERSFAVGAASLGSLMVVESVFEAFDGASGSPRVIDTVEGVAQLEDDYSAASRAAMRRDIERGFMVVVPGGRTVPVDAWWRVDPATGETLGMANDGRGQSMVEYLVMKGFSFSQAKTVVFVYYAVALYVQCLAILGTARALAMEESPVPFGACAVPLIGLGMATTAPTVAAAAAAFKTAEVVYTLAMFVNVMLEVPDF